MLVLIGTTVAAAVAWSVEPPSEVPSFALQAAPVYRLEVGAAVFVTAYVTSLTFVLALNNRAFSEIGMSGVKVRDIVGANRKVRRDERESLDALRESVKALHLEIQRDDPHRG